MPLKADRNHRASRDNFEAFISRSRCRVELIEVLQHLEYRDRRGPPTTSCRRFGDLVAAHLLRHRRARHVALALEQLRKYRLPAAAAFA